MSEVDTSLFARFQNWSSADSGFTSFDKGDKGYLTLSDLQGYISKGYGRKDDGFITRAKFDALMEGKFGVETKGRANTLFPNGATRVHYSDLEKLFAKYAGRDGKMSKDEFDDLRGELRSTVGGRF